MKKQLKSSNGLFGQTVHYENGVKVGESWPGLFEGSQNHYDANGKYIGYSDRGIFADQVHYDERGNSIGETRTGFFGQKKPYSANHRHIGNTWNGFTGDTTDISDGAGFFGNQKSDDSFDDGEW